MLFAYAALGAARPTLTELMHQSGSDKAGHHQYTLYYEQHLQHLRDEPVNFLEIGVLREASLKAWDSWFSRAHIFGGDRQKYPSRRILPCDQSNATQLRAVAALREWDVVLDDGSHVPSHQLETFLAFFPQLRPGGIYIIEDIETNYWKEGSSMYGYPTCRREGEELGGGCLSLPHRFSRAINAVNAPMTTVPCHERPRATFSAEIDAMIGSISFIRNAIIVRKHPLGWVARDHYGKEGCVCRTCQDCARGCTGNG